MESSSQKNRAKLEIMNKIMEDNNIAYIYCYDTQNNVFFINKKNNFDNWEQKKDNSIKEPTDFEDFEFKHMSKNYPKTLNLLGDMQDKENFKDSKEFFAISFVYTRFLLICEQMIRQSTKRTSFNINWGCNKEDFLFYFELKEMQSLISIEIRDLPQSNKTDIFLNNLKNFNKKNRFDFLYSIFFYLCCAFLNIPLLVFDDDNLKKYKENIHNLRIKTIQIITNHIKRNHTQDSSNSVICYINEKLVEDFLLFQDYLKTSLPKRLPIEQNFFYNLFCTNIFYNTENKDIKKPIIDCFVRSFITEISLIIEIILYKEKDYEIKQNAKKEEENKKEEEAAQLRLEKEKQAAEEEQKRLKKSQKNFKKRQKEKQKKLEEDINKQKEIFEKLNTEKLTRNQKEIDAITDFSSQWEASPVSSDNDSDNGLENLNAEIIKPKQQKQQEKRKKVKKQKALQDAEKKQKEAAEIQLKAEKEAQDKALQEEQKKQQEEQARKKEKEEQERQKHEEQNEEYKASVDGPITSSTEKFIKSQQINIYNYGTGNQTPLSRNFQQLNKSGSSHGSYFDEHGQKRFFHRSASKKSIGLNHAMTRIRSKSLRSQEQHSFNREKKSNTLSNNNSSDKQFSTIHFNFNNHNQNNLIDKK